MADEYKSIEENVLGELDEKFEKVKGPIREFAKYGIGAFYGVVATPFRIPTFIRKFHNEQTHLDRQGAKDSEILGTIIGTFGGMTANALLALYAVSEAGQENYVPALTVLATNVASGFYELGRSPISRREKKELQERLTGEKEASRLEQEAVLLDSTD